jgi:hypothetical protein
MFHDFCTCSRRYALLITATAMFGLAALPLESQNSRSSHSNSAQAVMHIQVNVVPVVMLPAARQSARAESSITYNVPSRPAKIFINEELRPPGPNDGLPPAASKAMVRVTTVVAD